MASVDAEKVDLNLGSEAFTSGGEIPARYGKDHMNVSPPLSWKQGPEDMKSWVIVLDDPDAPRGTFTHWILYNVRPGVRSLEEAIPNEAEVFHQAMQDRNDFGDIGYGGPRPPSGEEHRYVFRLYALDCRLDLQPGASRRQVMAAMEGHVLASSELFGTYAR